MIAVPEFNSEKLALDYVARHGSKRFLFPIKAGAKFPPCVKDNLNSGATNEPEQIRKLAKQFPGCNWGVALKKSNLFVADIDTNPKKGKVGRQTYDMLDLEYEWGDTETVDTPSGGFHLYYEGDHRFALGKYGLGPDIDSPNYVLIAGCTFDDGTSYKLRNPNTPTAPKPLWLDEVIKAARKDRVENASEAAIELDKPSQIAWAIDYLKNDAEASVEGRGGENTTFRVACTVKDAGISYETAVELMMEHYNVEFVCEPLWEREDLAKKIRNAYDYSSLSQVGGKSAEAEFGGDDVGEIAASIPDDIMGNPNATGAPNRKKRKQAKDDPSKPWNTQCAVIVSPASFVDVKSKKMLSTKSFNNRYGASGGAEAHKKAIKSATIARYDGVCYRPGGGDVAVIEGREHFNMYRVPEIQPLDGEPKIFLSHLQYLVPDDASREYLLDWLAWLIQHPDRKAMFAVLLIGKTRTGKSWIGDLLKVLLGKANCSEPSKKRVASDFNGWLSYKQLVIIHELREKGTQGLYDVLKELITQKTVPINLKGVEAFEIENAANFLTISNHNDALPLYEQDGRYLVIRCADEPRFGRGGDRSKDYYTRLFDCIGTADNPGDEARRVLRWLQRRVIKLNCENVAPETEAKAEMVEASRSNLEKFLRNALETKSPPLSCPIINPSDVLGMLSMEVENHARNLRSVEAALREVGARPLTRFGQVRTASGKKRLWALDGRRASYFLAKPPANVATIYDEGQKFARRNNRSDAEVDFGFAEEAPLASDVAVAEYDPTA